MLYFRYSKRRELNTMTTNNKTYYILSAGLLIIFSIICGYVIGKRSATPEPVEVVKYVEVQKEQAVDTTPIEQAWCGGFTDGTVRMVGAWWYADGVVEDEQGQLWGIEQSIDKEDFLLLWIADNNTPDKTTDDIIIKVWREAY